MNVIVAYYYIVEQAHPWAPFFYDCGQDLFKNLSPAAGKRLGLRRCSFVVVLVFVFVLNQCLESFLLQHMGVGPSVAAVLGVLPKTVWVS